MDDCKDDFLEQCFHDSENCPAREVPVPDWDHLRDL